MFTPSIHIIILTNTSDQNEDQFHVSAASRSHFLSHAHTHTSAFMTHAYCDVYFLTFMRITKFANSFQYFTRIPSSSKLFWYVSAMAFLQVHGRQSDSSWSCRRCEKNFNILRMRHRVANGQIELQLYARGYAYIYVCSKHIFYTENVNKYTRKCV